ncbi:28S ribosomal protein S23, mitochondrial-like [Panonychus citri]|uniref:28S ribosomal protein S23, mitochondrial-like n=1 Tax=Panonychus citri TaxID=50023 RepID=UPI0023083404|nr:28S ribosomal protein S23, mitochondrial-like [Panonychus citri]
MAQSRLHKFASIVNRVEGFLRSGAIKLEDKPIWFDVYKRFPPVKDPVYLQPLPEVKVKPIFYHEDKIRAEFYQVFGSPGVIDLTDSSKIPLSELFIEKYIEIAKMTETDVDDVTLFNLAANRLREAGYKLRKYSGSDDVSLPDVDLNARSKHRKMEKSKEHFDVRGLIGDD